DRRELPSDRHINWISILPSKAPIQDNGSAYPFRRFHTLTVFTPLLPYCNSLSENPPSQEQITSDEKTPFATFPSPIKSPPSKRLVMKAMRAGEENRDFVSTDFEESGSRPPTIFHMLWDGKDLIPVDYDKAEDKEWEGDYHFCDDPGNMPGPESDLVVPRQADLGITVTSLPLALPGARSSSNKPRHPSTSATLPLVLDCASPEFVPLRPVFGGKLSTLGLNTESVVFVPGASLPSHGRRRPTKATRDFLAIAPPVCSAGADCSPKYIGCTLYHPTQLCSYYPKFRNGAGCTWFHPAPGTVQPPPRSLDNDWDGEWELGDEPWNAPEPESELVVAPLADLDRIVTSLSLASPVIPSSAPRYPSTWREIHPELNAMSREFFLTRPEFDVKMPATG
ncbi:hypothetical protein BDK51DRAFT_31383, partial [Blyttiomyces helicus]